MTHFSSNTPDSFHHKKYGVTQQPPTTLNQCIKREYGPGNSKVSAFLKKKLLEPC
jgi:hypothetical protein